MIVHVENSRTMDEVVPQLQFDHGYVERTPSADCVFHRVNRHLLEMMPDSKNMDMPHVIAGTAKWVRGLEYERSCVHGDKESVLQLPTGNVAKECRLEEQDWQILRQVSPTQSHQSNGDAENAISAMRGLAHTYQALINDIIESFDVKPAAPMMPWTNHQTRIVGSHKIQRAQRHTHDIICEDSWTEIQGKDPVIV